MNPPPPLNYFHVQNSLHVWYSPDTAIDSIVADQLLRKRLDFPQCQETTDNTFLRPRTSVILIVEHAPTLVSHSFCHHHTDTQLRGGGGTPSSLMPSVLRSSSPDVPPSFPYLLDMPRHVLHGAGLNSGGGLLQGIKVDDYNDPQHYFHYPPPTYPTFIK